MDKQEFDRFAAEYEHIHSENIRITGEAPAYFHEYKIRDVALEMRRLGRSPRTILDFGCGVGNSIRALTHGPAFSKLLTERNPEPIVRDLAAANGAAQSLGIAALHFYSFGGFGKTVDWITAARAQ